MRSLAALLLAGCGFSGPKTGVAAIDGAPPGDGAVPIDSGPIVDGGPLGMLVVPHVPPANALPGTGTLSLSSAIDTTQLLIGAPLPQGVTFEHVAQPNGGPELAILHAGDVTVPAGATVMVSGMRPLVIIAYTITIAGMLDGSARRATPGPSGNTPLGAAGDGEHMLDSSDGGGGGGGYNGKGARGGNACMGIGQAAGGMGGVAIQADTIALLEGGGSGGAGGIGDCAAVAAGGGGGGALQLTAFTSISVATGGVIAVSGAGGLGGAKCSGDGSSGGGGGAGGAIVLNTPVLQQNGTVVANGGGGGGAGCFDTANPGSEGGTGQLSAAPAPGGAGVSCGSSGGAGGTSLVPVTGVDVGCQSNGGGGGAAAGRIGFFMPKTNRQLSTSGITSPPQHIVDSP